MLIVAEMIGVLMIIGLILYGARVAAQRAAANAVLIKQFNDEMAKDEEDRAHKLVEWDEWKKTQDAVKAANTIPTVVVSANSTPQVF